MRRSVCFPVTDLLRIMLKNFASLCWLEPDQERFTCFRCVFTALNLLKVSQSKFLHYLIQNTLLLEKVESPQNDYLSFNLFCIIASPNS